MDNLHQTYQHFLSITAYLRDECTKQSKDTWEIDEKVEIGGQQYAQYPSMKIQNLVTLLA